MSTTTQARSLFSDRRIAAKWVLARLYIAHRGLRPYRHIGAAYHHLDAAYRAMPGTEIHQQN